MTRPSNRASRDNRKRSVIYLRLQVAAYLNAALEEGSQEAFLLALQDVAEAKGISKTTDNCVLLT